MQLILFLLWASCCYFCNTMRMPGATRDWREFAQNADYEMKAKDPTLNDDVNRAMYEQELANGRELDEFKSSNMHYRNPDKYNDLSRRFIPVYPYKSHKTYGEKRNHRSPSEDLIPREAPKEVVLAVMKNAKTRRGSQKHTDSFEDYARQQYKMLRSGDYFDGVQVEEVSPKKILRSNNENQFSVSNDYYNGVQGEEVDVNKILRSNYENQQDYYNSVQGEEVDVNKILRSNNDNQLPTKLRKQNRKKSQRIRSQLKPGTKLYDLITKLTKYFPRLMIIES